ncbi:MAG: phosphoribosyltransferase [Nitrosotalea sp.]
MLLIYRSITTTLPVVGIKLAFLGDKMKYQEIILRNNCSTYFDVIQYPDGQRNIKLKFHLLSKKSPIIIKCSLKKFEDLEIFYCLLEVLVANDYFIKEIQFMYLFGLRSDRRFNQNEANYRNILLTFLKSNIPPSKIFFPHSFNNGVPWDCKQKQVFREILNNSYFNIFMPPIVIGGDESTSFNIEGYERFKKIRNRDGQIDVSLSESCLYKIKNYESILIVDDLCDGGATFIAESIYLKQLFPDKSINLFVAHALFTRGIDTVAEHFDKIFCTNSYQDINHPKVHQIKVL